MVRYCIISGNDDLTCKYSTTFCSPSVLHLSVQLCVIMHRIILSRFIFQFYMRYV